MTGFACSSHTMIVIVIVVLIITFTENIFTNMPVLKKLFMDPLNYILLIILIILVILIDMPCGIILAFLVLYLSVYMNHRKQMPQQRKVKFTDVIRNNDTMIRSESEFMYTNTMKPFPNGNLKPFQPVDQMVIDNASTSSYKAGSGVITQKDFEKDDFITRVGLPNRDGYDIAGCRYDFKNSPQNLTKNGPPLAHCAAYSGEQTQTCGTVFYPLHA